MTNTNIHRIAAKLVLSGGLALGGLALASGTAQAWNPQPDPPGAPGRPITIAVNSHSEAPGVQVAGGFIIGPSPLPPGGARDEASLSLANG